MSSTRQRKQAEQLAKSQAAPEPTNIETEKPATVTAKVKAAVKRATGRGTDAKR